MRKGSWSSAHRPGPTALLFGQAAVTRDDGVVRAPRLVALAAVVILWVTGCGDSDGAGGPKVDERPAAGSQERQPDASAATGVEALCAAASGGSTDALLDAIRDEELADALAVASLLGDWTAAAQTACPEHAGEAAVVADEVYGIVGPEMEAEGTHTTEPPKG